VPDLDLSETARDVPLAVQRVLDLARALAIAPDVILLDEMTAALPANLAERVLEVVRKQTETGRSIIFISHRFMEISALCDRATVLRDGQTVGVVTIEPGIEESIVELMLGERVERKRGAAAAEGRAHDATGKTRLSVRNLSVGNKLSDVSFDLHDGEIAGVVALEGQGQDELFAALAGSTRPSGGTIELEGAVVKFSHPRDAIDKGIAFVPGDRSDALLPQRSVRENIALPFSAGPRRWGPINHREERGIVDAAIARLQIDTRAQGEVRRLSGGNQQKVTIARWIAADARTILCFDPTRGIDVRTKTQIYALLRELAAQGKSILYYTSELEEIQLVCDRAIAIFGGRVVDTLPVEIADEVALTRAAYGLPREAKADVGILADTSRPGTSP
jgi:ribose transport system ATP-binding protein